MAGIFPTIETVKQMRQVFIRYTNSCINYGNHQFIFLMFCGDMNATFGQCVDQANAAFTTHRVDGLLHRLTVRQFADLMNDAGVKLLGVVLNKSDEATASYYY